MTTMSACVPACRAFKDLGVARAQHTARRLSFVNKRVLTEILVVGTVPPTQPRATTRVSQYRSVSERKRNQERVELRRGPSVHEDAPEPNSRARIANLSVSS